MLKVQSKIINISREWHAIVEFLPDEPFYCLHPTSIFTDLGLFCTICMKKLNIIDIIKPLNSIKDKNKNNYCCKNNKKQYCCKNNEKQ